MSNHFHQYDVILRTSINKKQQKIERMAIGHYIKQQQQTTMRKNRPTTFTRDARALFGIHTGKDKAADVG